MQMTAERLRCLQVVAKVGAGSSVSHDAPELAPFCDDASTLTKPDVFNQCHDAGWLHSGHDDRTGTSYVSLTDAGRQALANL